MLQISLSSHEEFSVKLMQYDTDYVVEVTTVEALTNKEATVDIETPNSNVLHCTDVTVDATSQTITFKVDTQITFKDGDYRAQISIYNSTEPTKMVSYYPFVLHVDKSVHERVNDPYETAVTEVKTLVSQGYKLAESWAHGNTGVRDGEDSDNAKYWYEKAKSAFVDISDTDAVKLSSRISALETGDTSAMIELCKINHGLNKYPTVDGYIGSYGAGLGFGPCGGTDITHVNLQWVCNDRNNITIYVSRYSIKDDDGSTMTFKEVNKASDGHWVAVFNGSNKSMQITLN